MHLKLMWRIFLEHLKDKKNNKIDLALSGYKELKDNDKKTIKFIIEFFNRNDT